MTQAATDPLDQAQSLLNGLRSARAAHQAAERQAVSQIHATLSSAQVAPVAVEAQPSVAAGAAPAVTSRSVGKGCLNAIITPFVKQPIALFLLATWAFGWTPATFNPANHTWYYPHVSCVPYQPGPGPGPKPPPPPANLGHLHATLIYDADEATQADAAVRESPTIKAALKVLDTDWRTLDKTSDAAALATRGLLPIAANVGLPALVIQDDAGKVHAATKLPATEADVIGAVKKLRGGT